MALGGLALGSLILYLKGMRRMMFQLSGFYYKKVGYSGLRWGVGVRGFRASGGLEDPVFDFASLIAVGGV